MTSSLTRDGALPAEEALAGGHAPRVRGAWPVVAIVVGLVLASLALRVEGLPQRLWMDEGISIGIAAHRVAAIPGLMARDGSPPLYYLMLHMWMSIFGQGENATHALSLAFALLTVPVGLWAGWSLFGRRVGWITSVLMATCPFLSIYAGETRMYTLVVLLTLVATTAYLHVFALGRQRHLPLLIVSLVATLYTHNWGLYLGLGMAVGLLAFLWRGAAPRDLRALRDLRRRAAIGFGAVALAYLPWIPTLWNQAHHTGAPWSTRPSARLAISTVADLLGDPFERVLVALLLTAGVALILLLRRPAVSPEQRGVAALMVTATVTYGAGWLSAQVKPAWSVRYLAVLLPAVLLLAAVGLARSGARGLAALGLILLFWVQPLGRITGAHLPLRRDDANDKQLAALVAPLLVPGDVVVAAQMEEVPVLRYYLGPAMRFADPDGLVADPTVVDWRDAPRRMAAARPRLWIAPLVETLPPGAHVYLVCRAATDTPSLEWFVIMDARCAEVRGALQGEVGLSRQTIDFSSVDDGGARVLALFAKTGPP